MEIITSPIYIKNDREENKAVIALITIQRQMMQQAGEEKAQSAFSFLSNFMKRNKGSVTLSFNSVKDHRTC